MNLEICRKCNRYACCEMFFRKDENGCFADIMGIWMYDHTKKNYQAKNRVVGIEIGIRLATSNFWVKKSGNSIWQWNVAAPHRIAEMNKLLSVDNMKVIKDKWEFEEYVPYDSCRDDCPYWLEHKISSLARGEEK